MEEIIFSQNSHELAVIYIMSAVLCSAISLYFVKVYRSFQSSYLLGILVGFSLVASSDFFFSTIVNLATIDEAFNILHWIQLIISSSGYVIIGSVYFFQRSNEKKFLDMMKLTLLALAVVIFTLTYVLVANIEIPSFTYYNEYLRLANVVAIGYATLSTLFNQSPKKKQITTLTLGFGLLLLSQCLRFFFAIDPSTQILYLSGFLKIVSFAIILLALVKEPKKSEGMELKEYEN